MQVVRLAPCGMSNELLVQFYLVLQQDTKFDEGTQYGPYTVQV